MKSPPIPALHLWFRLLVAATVIYLLSACGSPGGAPVVNRNYDVPSKPWQINRYTVRPGDTLYAIAWKRGVDHKKLAKWNQIKYPYTIYSGQRLNLGPTVNRVPKKASAISNSSKYLNRKKPSTASQKSKKAARFSSRDSTKNGLKISGRTGQSIRAAESGRVVYSGSGLIGYGHLIIIKHDKNYLSAYGYNRKLLVTEGDKVAKGERIAEMGRTTNGKAQLHFEIRREGKPVNPAALLPKQR